ncbi:MAG: hybrid sensor histidine kinase/response regulator [Bacteroidota bacterium]
MENLYNNTILIVDDTPENIDILVELLEDFEKQIAINGEDALETAWEGDAPDLILLDIMMPEMDGYEVCEKLRANNKTKDIPVIFLTAKTEKDDIVKGFEVGGQDYITKPFDARELMERVKTQLELKTQREILKNMNVVLEEKVQERTAQLNESNENLDKANKQLLVLDEAKNQFLMLISHEIRTPLNGIVGSAYFLDDMIQDPELKEFLDMLKESVDRLDKFSQTALEITQMQTVGRDLKKSSVNIKSIIEKEVESIISSANDKKITISTIYSEKEEIIAIEDYFKRAIKELIGNAVKFSNENAEIVISTFAEDDSLKISITDTGEVIPPEKIEDIIKPFGLGKDHYDKNIGLGLTYIKTFLDIHDATIEIKSSIEETKITLIFNII